MPNKQTIDLKTLLDADRINMGEHQRSTNFNKQNVLNIMDYMRANINMIQFNNFTQINTGVIDINRINNSILDNLIHYLGEGYTYDLGIPTELRNCWEENVLIPSIKEIFKHNYSIKLLNNINWTDSENNINQNDNPLEQSRGAYQTFGSLIFNGYFNTINEVFIQILKCTNTSDKLVLPLKFSFQLLWSGFRYFPNNNIRDTILNIFKNLNSCIINNKIFIPENVTFKYNKSNDKPIDIISSKSLLFNSNIELDIPLYAPNIVLNKQGIDISDINHQNLLESYKIVFFNMLKINLKFNDDKLHATNHLYLNKTYPELLHNLSRIEPIYINDICDSSINKITNDIFRQIK